MINYYKVLGLPDTASEEQIKIAYRKLSKKFHPDVNEGDKFFEERFKEIQEAYEKLSDPYFRKIYSDYIRAGNEPDVQKVYSYTQTEPSVEEPNTSKWTDNKSNLKGALVLVIVIAITLIMVIAHLEVERENAIEEKLNTAVIFDSIVKKTVQPDATLSQPSFFDEADTTLLPNKYDTQKWILAKLNNFSTDYALCTDTGIINRDKCKVYSHFIFLFNGNFMEIRYNLDNKINYITKIPLYYFADLVEDNSTIKITTSQKKIIETNTDNSISKLISSFKIGYRVAAEKDGLGKLKRAFKHLATFYVDPKLSK